MNTRSPVTHRLYLQMMRPEGQDLNDAQVAGAVAAANDDPELHLWWENERAFDHAFAAALSTIQPPDSLRATILAGMQASQRSSTWKRRSIIGLSAAAVVMIGAVVSWFDEGHHEAELSLASFRSELIETFEGLKKLDHETADPDQVRAWLARHEGASDLALPVGLRARSTIGCKVFDWRGAKVTLICFRAPQDSDHHAATTHLFVVNDDEASEFLNLQIRNAPLLAQNESWATAVWSEDGRSYLMISKGSLVQLAEVLR